MRLELEPRGGYVYATVSGEVELSEAQGLFRELLAGAARYGFPRILMDCTRVTGTWNPEDRMAFGTFMAAEQQRMAAQFGATPQVAILAVPPLMDPGRLTQTVANNRGARVRASDSLQELMSWLGI